MIGDRVADRFELTASLQRRGVIQTFSALDHQTQSDVELLLFDPTCATPQAWAAYARVVAAAAAARVKNLALPLAVSPASPERPFCVVDRISAYGLDTLRERDGLIPWERALTIGERIAEILHDVHAETRIAHRALLPSRCVLKPDDEVLVLDYGVAELESVQGRPDESGYRPPEHQQGGGDPQSDVYSLAVILFELMSGRRPSIKLPLRLRSLVPVPQAVDGLLAKALARNPGQRYADLGALRAALREILGLPAPPPKQPRPPEPAPPASTSGEPDLRQSSLPSRPLLPLDDGPVFAGPPIAEEAPPKGERMPYREPDSRPLELPDAYAVPRSINTRPAVEAVEKTDILPVVYSRRPQADPPTERIVHAPKPQTAESSRESAASGVSFDESPTLLHMPALQIPRAALVAPIPPQAPPLADGASAGSSLRPRDLEKTEILGRSVFSVEKTEAFPTRPVGHPESTMQLPSEDVAPAAPVPRAPSSENRLPNTPKHSEPTTTLSPRYKAFVVINLALAVLILIALFSGTFN